jgi:hypothetical protein
MAKNEKKRYKNIATIVSQEEYEKLQQMIAQTSDRSISSYIRKLILGKPVTIYYRDRAFDEFTEARIQFRKDVTLILERGGFNATEKEWLRQQLHIMNELHIKIHEHVCKVSKTTEH